MRKLVYRIRVLRHHLLIKPYMKTIAPWVLRVTKLLGFLHPAVVVKIDGGLGSQMWQYALGRAVQLGSGLPVFYDISWFDKAGKDSNGIHSRCFELLNVFPHLPFEKVSTPRYCFYKLHCDFYPGLYDSYDKEMLSSQSSRYLGGYYVHQRYIDEQGDSLRKLYRFNLNLSEGNKEVFQRITDCPLSVCVHVRRGDFVGSVFEVAGVEYYRSTIKLMSKKLAPQRPTFFIFSNGMAWAREALKGLDEDIVFIEENGNDTGAYDMFLMSQCAHFIICNSGFGWWAAWLSSREAQKIVLMPDRWLNSQDSMEQSVRKVDGWQEISV